MRIKWCTGSTARAIPNPLTEEAIGAIKYKHVRKTQTTSNGCSSSVENTYTKAYGQSKKHYIQAKNIIGQVRAESIVIFELDSGDLCVSVLTVQKPQSTATSCEARDVVACARAGARSLITSSVK